ncbi:MAG TPA: response regulator transcription factor [Solirubrobacteraceae bacterium]|nr:response regulator transcription factor [Solirubrobacteraceae bacterium]
MGSGDIVLIADEEESSRTLLAAVLRNAGYESLEAESGDEALELARTIPPAAAILEIPLPGLSGYELCTALKVEFGPDLPVIFLTGSRTESYDRVAGLLLGADDYLTKPYVTGELLVRLRNLLHRRTDPEASRYARRLTKREHEVLALMAEGLQHQEIGRRLFISPKTVATHVEHILHKLGARGRAQAVAIAYRHRILRPGPMPALPGVADQRRSPERRDRR